MRVWSGVRVCSDVRGWSGVRCCSAASGAVRLPFSAAAEVPFPLGPALVSVARAGAPPAGLPAGRAAARRSRRAAGASSVRPFGCSGGVADDEVDDEDGDDVGEAAAPAGGPPARADWMAAMRSLLRIRAVEMPRLPANCCSSGSSRVDKLPLRRRDPPLVPSVVSLGGVCSAGAVCAGVPGSTVRSCSWVSVTSVRSPSEGVRGARRRAADREPVVSGRVGEMTGRGSGRPRVGGPGGTAVVRELVRPEPGAAPTAAATGGGFGRGRSSGSPRRRPRRTEECRGGMVGLTSPSELTQ